MFGLGDKALAMIGGGASILLAAALAFTVISKNATIHELRSDKAALTVKVGELTSDLTQCRANRITLEDATRRQNEAVMEAHDASTKRVTGLQAAVQRAEAEAASARREVDRIMARVGSGDACKDANSLILEEAGR